MTGNIAATRVAAALTCGVTLAAMACEERPEVRLDVAPRINLGLSASTALSVAEENWTHLPVPPPDGDRIAPTTLASPIWATPEVGSMSIGYVRLGQKVPRSDRPVRREGCKGGWYSVAPFGYVCDGDSFTTDLEAPLVRAFNKAPDRSQPLPYKYAFVRAVAPNYLRIPTPEEQSRSEMRLERHLRSYERLGKDWDKIEPGANEVVRSSTEPFVQGSLAFHRVPSQSERYGGDGSDKLPFWLEKGRSIPNVSTFRAPPYAVMAGRIKRHAGVALIDSFIAGEGENARRFALSVDGRLIPSDKLKADTASPFHGYELGQTTLPVAFVVRDRGVEASSTGEGNGESLAHRALVHLTGDSKIRDGVRFVKSQDGAWLRASDLKIAPAPSTLPWFAKKSVRWIDISLLSQTLVLYEGARPKYVTLISSGRDGIGDPKTTLSTPTGTFRIYQKHVTTTMDSSVADSEFELRDVPWVMYFEGGYALHAAYWHDDFGRPRSHGCVNLSPIDARYVFNWTTPDVPEHWHGAYAGDSMGKGTLVHIHP
jgi:L,D-transpeptidase catalytic domain